MARMARMVTPLLRHPASVKYVNIALETNLTDAQIKAAILQVCEDEELTVPGYAEVLDNIGTGHWLDIKLRRVYLKQ